MKQAVKSFIPFSKIKGKAPVVVDALHPQHLTFSHWKGANTHSAIAADTSGEIALNAIHQDYPGWDAPFVTANHFDIDGFVGVFALLNPDLAMEFKEVLVQMAEIGDFRHYQPGYNHSEYALKLCCWMNQKEKELFYRPFGVSDEMAACVEKFEYFLAEFPTVLKDIENHKAVWEEDYRAVQNGLDQNIKRKGYPEIGLLQISADQPMPYYALFSGSEAYDLILSSYSQNRYELEYKYTTWVDIVSRPSFPRIRLKALAERLNELEQSPYNWQVDGITDTGPILRLEKSKISKADRFANPTEREIYSSSIERDEFIKLVLSFLKREMPSTAPAYFWTWEQMKKLKQQGIRP